MKVIIDIDDYVLDTDTDIDSDWVNVCNDELAESLNNAVKLSDVLQEIRQEIAEYHAHNGNGDDRSIDCRLFNVGIQIALEIIDDMIKELSE